MLIYITAPPTKHKKIIRRLHPLASCLLCLLPHCCLTLHPLCLFVRPFVCSFGWLLFCLSAPCHCFPSRHVATPRRCTALRLSSSLSSCCRRVIVSSHHCVVALLVVALLRCCVVTLSRRRVSSRLVDVLRPVAS